MERPVNSQLVRRWQFGFVVRYQPRSPHTRLVEPSGCEGARE